MFESVVLGMSKTCAVCLSTKEDDGFYSKDKVCKECRRKAGRQKRWRGRLRVVKGARSNGLRKL